MVCRGASGTVPGPSRTPALPLPTDGRARRHRRPARPAAGRAAGPIDVLARRADDGPAQPRLRPGLVNLLVPRGRPGPTNGDDAVITRRTKVQLLDLRDHHAARRHLRRRPLRPPRPAVLRRQLHRDRALRRLRRHLRRRRGDLPRRQRRPGRASSSSPTTASTCVLDIENGHDEIPADALAVVGNRSAVGEQYVELQPQSDDGAVPLTTARRSTMADTRTPIATETLLTDLSNTVVLGRPGGARRPRSTSSGRPSPAPARTCSGSSTPATRSSRTANDNFDVTTALIRDSNTVLHGQIDSASAIRTFARELSAVQRRRSPAPTRTCAGSSTPARRRGHPAAHLPRAERGRARRR